MTTWDYDYDMRAQAVVMDRLVPALAREFGISRDTLYRYAPVKKRRAGKLAK
jgi:hypothetical protein